MARKRAGGTRNRRPPRKSLQDKLLVWRGYVLVAVGGGGIAAVATAWYARQGDLLTSALFAVAFVLLAFTGIVAMARSRRLRAEIQASK